MRIKLIILSCATLQLSHSLSPNVKHTEKIKCNCQDGLSFLRQNSLTRRQILVESSCLSIWNLVESIKPAYGISSQEQSYDEFAQSYDNLDGSSVTTRLGIDDLRRIMTASADGRVLEVAVGTGLNLPYYNWSKVTRIDAIDFSEPMLSQAMKRSVKLNIREKIFFRPMNIETLGFPDNSFDTVVDTFGLCVFQNPIRALKEMKRVCAPNGKVLLLENSRSDLLPIAAYQDLTAEVLTSISKGCVWNQNVESLIKEAGLKVVYSSKRSFGIFRVFICSK